LEEYCQGNGEDGQNIRASKGRGMGYGRIAWLAKGLEGIEGIISDEYG
jgi:hypothetical protein